MKKIKLKSDRYRAARGGSAKLLSLRCSSCDSFILLYQKDGPGQLLRCYINRIFAPKHLAELQFQEIKSPSSMSALKCQGCQKLLATGMRHKDGRLAYRLIPGAVKKFKVTQAS